MSIESEFFGDLFAISAIEGDRPVWNRVDGAVAGGGDAAGAADGGPEGRRNAQLCMLGSTLLLYGGTKELGKRLITFSDVHAIQLGKRHGAWSQLQANDKLTEQWLEEESSSDDSEDDDDEAAAGGGSKPKGKGANPLKRQLLLKKLGGAE